MEKSILNELLAKYDALIDDCKSNEHIEPATIANAKLILNAIIFDEQCENSVAKWKFDIFGSEYDTIVIDIQSSNASLILDISGNIMTYILHTPLRNAITNSVTCNKENLNMILILFTSFK